MKRRNQVMHFGVSVVLLALACDKKSENDDYKALQQQNAALTSERDRLVKAKQELEEANKKVSIEYAQNEENLKKRNNQLTDALGKLARRTDTIYALEVLVAVADDKSDEQRNAIGKIYSLTATADLIEGYLDFLRKYEDAEQAKLAQTRLIQIAYEVAETQHTVEGYDAFLKMFPLCSKELREKALAHCVELENKRIEKDVEAEIASTSGLNEQMLKLVREYHVDQACIRLYNESYEDKIEDESVLFARKYNTILKAPVFADSKILLFLKRTDDMMDRLKQIDIKLDALRENFSQSNNALLSSYESLTKQTGVQIAYLQMLASLIEEQNKLLVPRPEFCWDNTMSPWMNFVMLGNDALKYITPAQQLLEVLKKR